MTFNFDASAKVITQSGTDADTKLMENNGATKLSAGGVDIYNKGDNRLDITGNYTISPEFEKILSSSAISIWIKNSGKFYIDGEITVDGKTTYSENYFIESSYFRDSTSTTYDPRYALIRVDVGGEIHWKGGYVKGKQPLYFAYSSDTSRAKVYIKNGGWNALGFYRTYPVMVRQYSNDVEVDGFKFINGGSWVDMLNPVAGNAFTNFNFNHAYGFGLSSGQSDKIEHTFRNYSAFNSKQDGGFWRFVTQKFVNAEIGSELLIYGYSTSDTDNMGVVFGSKNISINLKDDNGNIEGAKVYIPDTNDGHRINWEPDTYSQQGDNQGSKPINFTDDKTYNFTTDNQGNTGTQEILLWSAVRSVGGSQGNNDDGLNKKSFRNKNGDDSDVFDIHFWSYKHQYKVVEATLKGFDTLIINEKLFLDPITTETDMSVVSGYTTIDTSQQLYDYLKYYFHINYAGQNTMNLERLDNLIKSTTYDIEIDNTASQVFTLANNKITIKSDEFTGNLDLGSSKTLTLADPKLHKGTIIDSNGDSYYVFTSISKWELYSDDTRTNKIGEGTTANFRFNIATYPVNTLLYGIFTTTGGAEFKQKIKVIQKGENIYSLDTTLLYKQTNTTAEKNNNLLMEIAHKLNLKSPEIETENYKNTFEFGVNDADFAANKFSVTTGLRSGTSLTFVNNEIQIDATLNEEYVMDFIDIGKFSLTGGLIRNFLVEVFLTHKEDGRVKTTLFEGESNGRGVIQPNTSDFDGFKLSLDISKQFKHRSGFSKLEILIKVDSHTSTARFHIGEVKVLENIKKSLVVDSPLSVDINNGEKVNCNVVEVNGTTVNGINDFKGSEISTQSIAEAVWDATISLHDTDDSFGKALQDSKKEIGEIHTSQKETGKDELIVLSDIVGNISSILTKVNSLPTHSLTEEQFKNAMFKTDLSTYTDANTLPTLVRSGGSGGSVVNSELWEIY